MSWRDRIPGVIETSIKKGANLVVDGVKFVGGSVKNLSVNSGKGSVAEFRLVPRPSRCCNIIHVSHCENQKTCSEFDYFPMNIDRDSRYMLEQSASTAEITTDRCYLDCLLGRVL